MSEVVPQVKLTRSSTTNLDLADSSAKGASALDGAVDIASTTSRSSPSAREAHSNKPESLSSKTQFDGSGGGGRDGPEATIDPLSRQILERTNTQHTIPQSLYVGGPKDAVPGRSDESAGGAADRNGTDPGSIHREDSTASIKMPKDKKKGVSFLNRIIGTKKKSTSPVLQEDESEALDNRPAGMNAELFSQPIGFIPQFPGPPKYIKVKAQNRKTKDFDRVFLAQVLLGQDQKQKRKSTEVKAVNFDVSPAIPGPSASKAIWAMEFSKDGKYLAAAGQDKKLRVWAVISTPEEREAHESGENEGDGGEEGVRLNAPVFNSKLVREYDGHTASILDLSWSKNNFLLSSSMDKTVRLYHVTRSECLCAFKHNDFVTSIQFHPRDDRFFLAGSLDSKLRLWSIPDKSVAFWVNVPDMVTAVAFTPDGKTAIAGCLNGYCIFYETEGLKAHSQIHVKSARGRNAKGSKITGIDTTIMHRENTNGEVKLLITSNDSRVRMYNMKDRSLEIKFRGNENACSQIHATFSDDGKYVICGSEDRKVYIWPTGPLEKHDPEKRPVEVFEAHSAIVTTAIMAPTKARQLLAQSGDPLYDLCNPPPVTLLSRTESVISSRAPTDSGRSIKDVNLSTTPPQSGDSPKRAKATPAYHARSAHPGGNVIITADYSGQIKIFRQDCAYQKRRSEHWDNSAFSKKILGRSGSVTTRTSISSNRNSLNIGHSKNNSADRIINWRSSITSNSTGHGHSHSNSNGGSISDTNVYNPQRARSVSPKKSDPKSSPHRHGSLLSKHASQSTHTSPTFPEMPFLRKHRSSQVTAPGDDLSAKSQNPPEVSTNTAKPPNEPEKLAPKQSYQPAPHSADDPLYLQGDQSFMYWNIEHSMAPMAARIPRTPGLLSPESGNPLSRRNSVVSQLSSEQLSSAGTSAGEDDESKMIGSRAGKEDEIKCHKCGNRSFRATTGDGGQKLRCKRCGTVVE